MRASIIFFIVIFFPRKVGFCYELNSQQCVSIKHYDLEVLLKLESNSIEVRGVVQLKSLKKNLTEFSLSLNRNFEIDYIFLDGKELEFTTRTNEKAYHLSKLIEIDLRGKTLVNTEEFFIEISYKGKINGTIGELNIISPDITELSSYASWIPTTGNGAFRYSLKLMCPAKNIIICNADFIKDEISENQKIAYWHQPRLVSDIILIVSQHFKKIKRKFKNFTVNFYYSLMPQRLALKEIDDIMYTLRTYSDLFGKCKCNNELVIVYSQRGGWGYKRDDVTVMSEIEAIAAHVSRIGKRPEDFGLKRDPNTQMAQFALFGLKNYMGHEPCHYWWGGGIESSSLWIVEGFAQFSDIYLAETKFGAQNSKKLYLLLEMLIYRNIKHDTPLCDVTRDQIDCHDHAYKKGSWILRMLRAVMGDKAFFGLLKAFYEDHRETGEVTPGDFQRYAERFYGKKLDWFFDEWIWNYYQAPTYELEYTVFTDGEEYKIEGAVSQTGKNLFRMPLEIGIKNDDDIEFKKIWTESAETPFVFKTKFKPSSVVLDPRIKVLQHTNRTQSLTQ